MNEELRDFLAEIGLWMLTGAAVGVAIRWGRPAWARSWRKFALNRRWKLFTFAALLFGAAAVIQWHEGHVYHALLSILLCILEIAALFLYGFQSFTPEMERKIDAS